MREHATRALSVEMGRLTQAVAAVCKIRDAQGVYDQSLSRSVSDPAGLMVWYVAEMAVATKCRLRKLAGLYRNPEDSMFETFGEYQNDLLVMGRRLEDSVFKMVEGVAGVHQQLGLLIGEPPARWSGMSSELQVVLFGVSNICSGVGLSLDGVCHEVLSRKMMEWRKSKEE